MRIRQLLLISLSLSPLPSTPQPAVPDVQELLFRRLLNWRAVLMSMKKGLLSHHILTNPSLKQISELRPSSLEVGELSGGQ